MLNLAQGARWHARTNFPLLALTARQSDLCMVNLAQGARWHARTNFPLLALTVRQSDLCIVNLAQGARRTRAARVFDFALRNSETERHKSSVFVRTAADWNKPEGIVLTADSVTAFSSAAGRELHGAVSHTQAARAKMF